MKAFHLPRAFMFVSLFFIAYVWAVNAAAQCCTDSTRICQQEAEGFASRFLEITSSPLFKEEPNPDVEKLEGQLRAIKKKNASLHKQFTKEIRSYTKWLKPDEGNRADCVYRSIEEEDEINKDWIRETTSMLRKFKDYSPEFCRGFRFHFEMGMGVKDLSADSESFMGSLGALASYTFAPTDKNVGVDPTYDRPHCNGHFRISAGLSEAYVDQRGLTQGLLRMEYKLFDLKTDFFSLGNVKAITQGSFGLNRNFNVIGLGVGAETEIIGVNLIYGIGLDEVKSTLQLSFVYNTKLIKK